MVNISLEICNRRYLTNIHFNPGLQSNVFNELLDIYADYDIANGTELSEGFLLNFAEGLYTKYRK